MFGQELALFEAGGLTPAGVLAVYLRLLDTIAQGGVALTRSEALDRLLLEGDGLYIDSLEGRAPPRQYNLALRMLGLGVETRRARARRLQAEVRDTPDDGGPLRESPPARTPSPPRAPSPQELRAPSPPPRAASPQEVRREAAVWRPWEGEAPNLPVIEVQATSQRTLKNFKVTCREETIQIGGVVKDILTQENMESFLQTVLDRQIKALGAAPHDKCFMEIDSSEHTERPVYLGVRRIDQLAPDVILNQVVRTLNSNQNFLIDGKLRFKMIHIPVPHPGGRHDRRPCETVETWLQRYGRNSGAIFSPATNDDNMCLARCIVIGTMYKNVTKFSLRRLKQPGSRILREKSKELCVMAGVDHEQPCGLEEVDKFQKVLEKYRLCVFTDRRGKDLVYAGPKSTTEQPRTNICLFLHEGHYHTVLKPATAFGWVYFCDRCLEGYASKGDHHCVGSCWRCGGPEEHPLPESVDYIDCDLCGRFFGSQECFEYHRDAKIHAHGTTTCQVKKYCSKCNSVYSLNARGKRKRTQHVCNSYYCKYCKDIVVEAPNVPHRCYILPWEEQPLCEKTDYLRIYADCETTQYELFQDKDNWYEHKVNYLVCQVVCELCEKDEGDFLTCPNHGARTKIFHSLDELERNPVADFLNFLEELSSMKPSLKEKTKRHITIWNHNGAGFDHHLLLQEMASRGKIPSLICKGLRILSMNYGSWVFKDSCLFLGTKLSNLPGCFGIDGVKKGDFPYLFNHPDHYSYIGPMPPKQFYSVGKMSVKDAKSFEMWHEAQLQAGVIFNFREEIREYTVNDVRILRLACEKFRTDFIEETGFDCLHNCLTLSSTTFCIFRRSFMRPHTMGIIPRPGFYRGLDTCSLKALRWLEYENSLLNQSENISHAGNGREVRLLGKYKVDGYVEREGDKIVYDFLGCWHHSHPPTDCLTFKNVTREVRDKRAENTRQDRYYRTMRIHDTLKRAGYKIKTIWECQFDMEQKYNPHMISFFEKNKCEPPSVLNERDGLYGGRTGAFKAYYKCDIEAGEKIMYYDVQSLYPAVLCLKRYPIGHPDVFVGEDPAAPPLDQTEGYISCTVLPPLDLLLPLLPWRSPNGRLLFVLCRTCGEEENQGGCTHNRDEDRCLKGVWPVPEVRKALQLGYIILKVEEVWHYPHTMQYDVKTGEEGLFSKFITHWMRKKIEASGWPSHCSTEEAKEEFIEGNKKLLGITVDPAAMKKNASLRHLYKGILNSAWGKACERPERAHVVMVKTYSQLISFVSDDTIQIHSIIPISDDVIHISYTLVEACQESLPTNSVIHGAYTTMYGRLELYKHMELLQDRLCYGDTDSVVFVSRPGCPDPPLGPYLGQLSDELEAFGPNSFCYEFCSGGAKQYAMKIACGGDVKKTQVILKLRGVTVNQSCSDIVTFERFKDMVLHGKDPTLIDIPAQIARVKGWRIVTRPASKIWRPCLTKRQLTAERKDTRPYGFQDIDLDEDDEATLQALMDLSEQ
ncbi:DNA polymerase [Frankliniella fusca]|uniref:DNA-directed DNA polymerase n=1 Tax=Frankliniella fusca TaxID=407009 RepID=A0AAE1H954_9NEOP|nr:DNA polymerase [Frankliniella fusca]